MSPFLSKNKVVVTLPADYFPSIFMDSGDILLQQWDTFWQRLIVENSRFIYDNNHIQKWIAIRQKLLQIFHTTTKSLGFLIRSERPWYPSCTKFSITQIFRHYVLNSAKNNSKLVSKQWQANITIFPYCGINLLPQFISRHTDWWSCPLFIEHTRLPILKLTAPFLHKLKVHYFWTIWGCRYPWISLGATFSNTKKHILHYGIVYWRHKHIWFPWWYICKC